MTYQQRAIMKAIDEFHLNYTLNITDAQERKKRNESVNEYKKNVQALFEISSMDVLFRSSQEIDIAEINNRVLLNNQIHSSACWREMYTEQYPATQWLVDEINNKVWPNHLFKKMMTKKLPDVIQDAETRHSYNFGEIKADPRFSALLLEHIMHAFWKNNPFALKSNCINKKDQYTELSNFSSNGILLSSLILAILGITIGAEYGEIHRVGEDARKDYSYYSCYHQSREEHFEAYESWREERYEEIKHCEIACMVAAGIFLISLIGLCYGEMQRRKAENDEKFVEKYNDMASRISEDMFAELISSNTQSVSDSALLQWSAKDRGIPAPRVTPAFNSK